MELLPGSGDVNMLVPNGNAPLPGTAAMKLHIQFLRPRHREPLREALQKDGWHLTPAADAGLRASHPEVRDEATARDRLGRLGVLPRRWSGAVSPSKAKGRELADGRRRPWAGVGRPRPLCSSCGSAPYSPSRIPP